MHRGEWLEQQIKSVGYSKEEMVDLLGIARSTLYRWLLDENVQLSKMKRVTDLLNLDLRETFPDSAKLYEDNRSPVKKLKDSYDELVQKYTSAIEELSEYRRLHGNLPGQNRD